MANRLVSNMYIIDSHQIALPLAYGSSQGTSETKNSRMLVKGVVFIPVDTTGACVFALGNTNNRVLRYQAWGSGTMIQSGVPQVDHWDVCEWLDVYIPTLTAATACLILG